MQLLYIWMHLSGAEATAIDFCLDRFIAAERAKQDGIGEEMIDNLFDIQEGLDDGCETDTYMHLLYLAYVAAALEAHQDEEGADRATIVSLIARITKAMPDSV